MASAPAAFVNGFIFEGVGFGKDFIGLIWLIAGMFGLLVESGIFFVVAVVGRSVAVTHKKINN